MKLFLTVTDVMKLTGCGRSKAYELIRRLNRDLAEMGYLTCAGKIERGFCFERLHIDPEEGARRLEENIEETEE